MRKSLSELPRITDLSSIQAENLKQRNTDFLWSDQEYSTGQGLQGRELRHDIWVVRNGDLRRIFRDFPLGAPLPVQCAGWMHAVVGKHYFPDANHRTAMATLRRLLATNGIQTGEFPHELTMDTSIRSHEIRREIDSITLDKLYRHDRLFLVWLLYFNQVLRLNKVVEKET